MPLPLLFLAADAWVWLGRVEEAGTAFNRLEKRVRRYMKKEGGREEKKEEEEEEQRRKRNKEEGGREEGGEEEGEEGGVLKVLSQSMQSLSLSDAVALTPQEVRWWLAKVCPCSPSLPPSLPPSLW